MSGSSPLKTKSIEYKSANEKNTVWQCLRILHAAFCQKLHQDLQSYLDAGISIKFLAFPRAGLNSVVAGNMAKKYGVRQNLMMHWMPQ
nr:hypothetical protein [Escherichia coli]